MYKLIKNVLIEPNNSTRGSEKEKISVLNIGPGPSYIAKEFVNTLLPVCDSIILCEVNPLYCKDYIQSDWYKSNSNFKK